MSFSAKKEALFSGCDLSRKGYIDAKAEGIVHTLNGCPFYCTTSSCSGRIVVFEWREGEMQERHSCNWLLVSHDPINMEELKTALSSSTGNASLRFEPFILHVSCETMKWAKPLHTAALESGFKNSGLTISKRGGITLAMRNTLFLEIPLTAKGKILVSDEYLAHLVNVVNEKFAANEKCIEKLSNKINMVVASL